MRVLGAEGKRRIEDSIQILNCPTQAKRGLEWATRQFHNASSQPVRLLCVCSPAGLDEFFLQIGVPVDTRTTPPPQLDAKQQAAFMEKAKALAPKYRTEFLAKA